MSEPYEAPESPAEPPPAPPPVAMPPRQRRSCAARIGAFFSWLLTLVLAVGLALVAGGAVAYWLFGYRADTPARLAEARGELVMLREENSMLQTQVALAQTEVAGARTRAANNAEQLDELNNDLETMAALATSLRENVAQAATVQAQARDSQAAVAAFATVQAASLNQIDELDRRTERIARFLERLSDIAGDTVLDLDGSAAGQTPTVTATVTPTAPPATGTPTATPTATP